MRVATAFILLFVITLFGCDRSAGVSFAPAADQGLGGVWEGTDSDGTEIVALSTDSGRFHWLAETGDQGFGTGSVSGSAVTLNYTLVAPLDFTLFDGSASATCSGIGTIEERQTLAITVDCTTSLGGTLSTSVSLTYNSLFDRDSALSVIAGIYEDEGLVFNINADGVIFEQDPVFGCVLGGQVSIIDPNFNAYDVSLSVSNCVGQASILNGSTFTGLAILDDTELPEVLFAALTGAVGVSTFAIVFDISRV